MAKGVYKVIQVFEASDGLFRAKFDFGFDSTLRIYYDCATCSMWSCFDKGCCDVPRSVLLDCYSNALYRFRSYLSGRARGIDSEKVLDNIDVGYELF